MLCDRCNVLRFGPFTTKTVCSAGYVNRTGTILVRVELDSNSPDGSSYRMVPWMSRIFARNSVFSNGYITITLRQQCIQYCNEQYCSVRLLMIGSHRPSWRVTPVKLITGVFWRAPVCLVVAYVCLSYDSLTFEILDLESSFLVCEYIFI